MTHTTRTTMPFRWLIVALWPFVASCGPDTLVVPVRTCVIQGATIAPANAPLNMPNITTESHEIVKRASKILMAQADIALLPYPDVRVIADPNPSTADRQQVGDVVQDLGRGDTPQEASDAVQACNVAWTRESSILPPGVTLVLVRDFPTSSGGVNIDLKGVTPKPGPSLCQKPYAVDPTLVRARWSVVKTHLSADMTHENWLTNVSHTTAHELGHLMMLGHGNGQDDDGNGVWDEECDPIEYNNTDLPDPQTSANLMSVGSYWGTTLTARQRELARAVAAKLAN